MSWDPAYNSERLYPHELISQGSINMVKVLWFSFGQSFFQFTMLLVEQSSETGLFRHWSNQFFGVRQFKIHQLWGSPSFCKFSKLNLNLRKAKKNWTNIFCFWDNCIWKYCYEWSLLRTEYLLSAVNGLPKSSEIFCIT